MAAKPLSALTESASQRPGRREVTKLNASGIEHQAQHGREKHGLYRLKRSIKELGTRAIALDRRSTVAKAMQRWRNELVRDLGGELSAQQRAVVELALKTKLMLDSIDAWLLVQPSLINKRKRALLPVVRERQVLADALARYLDTLGLERRAAPVPSLSEWLASREGNADESAEPKIQVTIP
jgi:hypothetical protein